MGSVIAFLTREELTELTSAKGEESEVNISIKKDVRNIDVTIRLPFSFSEEEVVGTTPTTLGFLRTSFYKNLYAEEPFFDSLYIRKSFRVFMEDDTSAAHSFTSSKPNCFDIASVEVQDQFKGKGVFTDYVNYLLDILPREAPDMNKIYVENVLNERFAKYLENELGMTKVRVGDNTFPPSFFLRIS